jgi:hypothetical protein
VIDSVISREVKSCWKFCWRGCECRTGEDLLEYCWTVSEMYGADPNF